MTTDIDFANETIRGLLTSGIDDAFDYTRNGRPCRRLPDRGTDHLAAFPELSPYRRIAADGHTIQHASHAERRPSGNHNPVSCIYALDLRRGLCRAFPQVSGDGQRRHEWPVFERALLSL